MLIWDDAITICQRKSSDSTAEALASLKQDMNLGYKIVLGELGRDITSKTKTAVTIAQQQFYQLPNDYVKMKAIKITVGSTTYPLIEEEAQEMWDIMNMTAQYGDIPSRYFIRNSFGYGGSEVGIFPIPSSADNVITLIYEGSDKDLSQSAYTTGNVAVTNGSATINGSGTTFTKGMVGRYFNITDADGDGMWYKIASFTSAGVITLENVYEGETDSSANYKIAEAFGFPEDIQMAPVWYALQMYFADKQNVKQEAKYAGLYDRTLALAKRKYATKSRSSIIRGNSGGRFRSSYPGNFPSNGVTS